MVAPLTHVCQPPPPPLFHATAQTRRAGCDATALLALGFTVPDLFMLLRDGLAVPRADRVVDGRRQFDLTRLTITAAGRAALAKAMA